MICVQHFAAQVVDTNFLFALTVVPAWTCEYCRKSLPWMPAEKNWYLQASEGTQQGSKTDYAQHHCKKTRKKSRRAHTLKRSLPERMWQVQQADRSSLALFPKQQAQICHRHLPLLHKILEFFGGVSSTTTRVSLDTCSLCFLSRTGGVLFSYDLPRFVAHSFRQWINLSIEAPGNMGG